MFRDYCKCLDAEYLFVFKCVVSILSHADSVINSGRAVLPSEPPRFGIPARMSG